MRVGIAVGVGLLCLVSVGVVAANEPPLASAGLDQEARANTTVYLDAGGSVDPDGSISDYEWTIETPDGNTTTPDCVNCAQTWFVPRETGRYNVTVRVRDEDGVGQRDTLYVAVSAQLAVPSSPSSGGAETVGGSFGGGESLGTWNAVVNEGEDLILSTTRGRDFVLDTPLGQVRIGSSAIERAREPDGDLPYENVKDYFQAVGLSEEILRDVASRSLSEGDTCKSTRGECTTHIPDAEELTEEARRNMGLYSEYESESSSSEPETAVTDSKDDIVADITGTVESVVGFTLSDESDGKDSSVTSSGSVGSDDDHSGGWDNTGSTADEGSTDRNPANDDKFGSQVP